MRDYGTYGFPISTLFWGAVIFVALVVSCLLILKALAWLRHKLEKSDGAAVKVERPEAPKGSWEQAISRPEADHNHVPGLGGGSDLGGFEGLTQSEQEYLFSTYAPRKVRKAMKQRRKAREQRQNNGDR
jgi:hypothetical protein